MLPTFVASLSRSLSERLDGVKLTATTRHQLQVPTRYIEQSLRFTRALSLPRGGFLVAGPSMTEIH